MRHRTAAFLTAAVLATASLPAAAQGYGPPGHGRARGEDGFILHLTKELGLSETQAAQVKTISDKYKDGDLGQAMDSVKPARLAVQKAIHDVNATDDQVRQAAAVVAALESQIAVEHHQMALEISSVLTPDQRTKLAETFSNMQERHQGPPMGGPDGF